MKGSKQMLVLLYNQNFFVGMVQEFIFNLKLKTCLSDTIRNYSSISCNVNGIIL